MIVIESFSVSERGYAIKLVLKKDHKKGLRMWESGKRRAVSSAYLSPAMAFSRLVWQVRADPATMAFWGSSSGTISNCNGHRVSIMTRQTGSRQAENYRRTLRTTGMSTSCERLCRLRRL